MCNIPDIIPELIDDDDEDHANPWGHAPVAPNQVVCPLICSWQLEEPDLEPVFEYTNMGLAYWYLYTIGVI